MSFKERAEQVVRNIPKGSTMSYGEVAIRAGNPGAARAVGTLMKNNDDDSVPCHRVIKSNGELGGYNGRLGEKKKLLEAESGRR